MSNWQLWKAKKKKTNNDFQLTGLTAHQRISGRLAQQDGFLLEFGPDDVGKADGDHDYFDDDAQNCNKRCKQANRFISTATL
ncbi:hypothetical protein TYRP_002576 [Tyrophagus putrescentiae]|nr:hypothetical protein TYRP_002576 [Tyrophagus putrescentiae]